MLNKRIFSAVLIPVLLTGCTGFHKEYVQFDHLFDCPEVSDAEVAAKQNQLSPMSETHSLECALTVVRNSHDPKITSTALGGRLCLLLAEREINQEKREKLATEGVGFSETALAHGGDNDGAVHYYLAANLGLVVREHITLAMENLGRLESEMKQAVALNPDIDSGGPMRLLGALYLKAPAWPNGIGDIDKALELLEKAVKNHPEHPLNHLFYAQVLWYDSGETALPQVKAEFALGEELLTEGNWGYNKETWKKEFAEFAQEFEETN